MSSSNLASFTRALSPSIEALTQAVISNTLGGTPNDDDRIRLSDELILVLHSKISESRSIDQVIDCVYFDYRPAFKPWLLSYAAWCDKKETVGSSEERLRLALNTANPVTPNRLKVKAPEFQLTKEFSESGSEEALAASAAFTAATTVFQAAVNAGALAAKKAELDFWVDKCDPAKALEALSDILAEVWADRRIGFKIPTISYDANGTGKIGQWQISPQKRAERDALTRAIPLLASQIAKLVQLRHRAMAKKIEKKKEVSAKADVEMADATKPGPSIQSLIDKGLNARLKKLNLVPAGKKKSSGPNTAKSSQPNPPKPNNTKASSSKIAPPVKGKAPATKANKKIADKKKGKGRAPVKGDQKGKGKA